MKIYVMADMEGISGIHLMQQVKKEFPFEYEYGRKMLMQGRRKELGWADV